MGHVADRDRGSPLVSVESFNPVSWQEIECYLADLHGQAADAPPSRSWCPEDTEENDILHSRRMFWIPQTGAFLEQSGRSHTTTDH